MREQGGAAQEMQKGDRPFSRRRRLSQVSGRHSVIDGGSGGPVQGLYSDELQLERIAYFLLEAVMIDVRISQHPNTCVKLLR